MKLQNKSVNLTLLKVQRTKGIEYPDSNNTSRYEQKFQQALNSWSNFSSVLFGKMQEIIKQLWQIHLTILRNPFNNYEIHVPIFTNTCTNFDKSMWQLRSCSQCNECLQALLKVRSFEIETQFLWSSCSTIKGSVWTQISEIAKNIKTQN